MSLGIQLIMTTALVTGAPACSWAHPGANPYRGDPVHALADFAMPAETRRKLRAAMVAHQYSDVATITRDDIVGEQGYTDLREMHSGRGQVCHGPVDRTAWAPDRHERGLVYCADDTCVIVPTICNNVSLVSRKPAAVALAAPEDEPIDIAPAAGPPTLPDAAPDTAPLAFTGTPDVPGSPDTPGAGGGAGYPGGPIGGGGGFPGGPGGGDVIVPVTPGGSTPPITPPSAVPELPTAILLLAGLVLLPLARRRRSAS